MGIKTVKLKADEYFTIDDIKPIPYFLIGGRGTGKSWLAKHYVKDMVLDSDFAKKYLYVRINRNEIPTHDSWLMESGITESLPFDASDVQIKRGIPFAGAVSLEYVIPTGVEKQHIGYVASLETSALVKSGVYDDVGCIVFEEFLRRGLSAKQVDDYCFNFMEMIETVCRDREIPIFFIANTLNAFNPLMNAFNDYQVIKIFSENRRKNIAKGMFSDYLQGEQYTTADYDIRDFDYLFTLKCGNQPLSFYADRFTHKDILITSSNNNSKERLDLVYALQRDFLYSFSALKFLFDNDKTEVYFYSNIDSIKLKIRNKLTALLNL